MSIVGGYKIGFYYVSKELLFIVKSKFEYARQKVALLFVFYFGIFYVVTFIPNNTIAAIMLCFVKSLVS